MRLTATMLGVALLAACAPADDTAEQATEQPTEQPAGPTLADFAGTWEFLVTVEGAAEPVSVLISGSADGSDWVMTAEDRDPIPMTVSVQGDSMIGETAEYESLLREGVMVRVRTASVLADGMLTGVMTATYTTADGEELVPGTVSGTRAEVQ